MSSAGRGDVQSLHTNSERTGTGLSRRGCPESSCRGNLRSTRGTALRCWRSTPACPCSFSAKEINEAKQAGRCDISRNVPLVCVRSVSTHLLLWRSRCGPGTHRVVGEVRVAVIAVKPERENSCYYETTARGAGGSAGGPGDAAPRRTGARGSAGQRPGHPAPSPRTGPDRTGPARPRPAGPPPRPPPRSLGHGAPRRPRRQEVTHSRNDAFRRLTRGGSRSAAARGGPGAPGSRSSGHRLFPTHRARRPRPRRRRGPSRLLFPSGARPAAAGPWEGKTVNVTQQFESQPRESLFTLKY